MSFSDLIPMNFSEFINYNCFLSLNELVMLTSAEWSSTVRYLETLMQEAESLDQIWRGAFTSLTTPSFHKY